jgi:hypothetical protein
VVESIPETKVKKMKKAKCMPEPIPEPIVEVIPEPIPEVIPELVVETYAEPIVEVIPEKPKRKAKKPKTEEEQAEDDQRRIEFLKQTWDDYETRFSFQEIQKEIESYQPPNEVLQKFKDSYYSRFMNGYMDRRPKVVAELDLEPEKPVAEKPRRKLKIIQDPPKLPDFPVRDRRKASPL